MIIVSTVGDVSQRIWCWKPTLICNKCCICGIHVMHLQHVAWHVHMQHTLHMQHVLHMLSTCIAYVTCVIYMTSIAYATYFAYAKYVAYATHIDQKWFFFKKCPMKYFEWSNINSYKCWQCHNEERLWVIQNMSWLLSRFEVCGGK